MNMRKFMFVILVLSISPSFVGCSESMEAKPAEKIVTERPVGYEKGSDGKMAPSKGMQAAPAKP